VTLRKALVAVVALAISGLPTLVRPATAATHGPIISDPAGDGTGFIFEGVVPLPNEPSLDIRSADLVVSASTLTATVKVVDLKTEPPPGGNGRVFRWDFSYGGRAYELLASQGAGEAAALSLSDAGNGVDCAECAASFDPASDVVTMTVPLGVINRRIATTGGGQVPAIGGGAKLYQLSVTSQRQLGQVTATADSATSDLGYTVPGGARVSTTPTFRGKDERGDAVVIAVIDINLVPYHWDFDSTHMPQQLDGDKSNDLPLTTPPNKWLPGFPDPKTFKSFQALPNHQAPTAPQADIATLDAADANTWAKVKTSTPDSVNYYWLPGTKVIGAVEFNTDGKLHGTTDDHGVGVASVSVGNLHGTCPECLLVFINTDDSTNVDAALDWATRQPWIDVITNSWTLNIFADGLGVPLNDNVHTARREAEQTRAASTRGQSIFFAAGNGVENGFIVPNQTQLSSLSGPDWITTVGATTPSFDDESGAGKTVDVAGVGESYPSAYTATHVGGTGLSGFSGTSNATPTVAGTYARALYQARRLLPGPSRVQRNGVIGRGNKPFSCGKTRPGCELGDGVLTAAELRNRLLLGAVHRNGAFSVGGLLPVPKPFPELEYADVGHGVYGARIQRTDKVWLDEIERIVGPLTGRARELERPTGERDWMIVDSYCRQRLWGPWAEGYYVAGRTPLPGPDPNWPLRTALATACQAAPAL
jgi:hypothetical protein